MATLLKSAPRYATSDWHTSNHTISTNAERMRVASNNVRQEVHNMRNETDNTTQWDQHDNNTRLLDRVDIIRKWKDILDKTLADTDKEIADLSTSKEHTEQALEDKNKPTEINLENLVRREGRQDIDLVNDEVQDELNKEKEVISDIKGVLQQRIASAVTQLTSLQSARHQLLLDIQDKNEALGIDVKQYNLTEDDQVTYKPNPTRVPKGSVTPQNWEDFSRHNKNVADSEMSKSRALREAIHHTLNQTDTDLDAKQKATDYSIRKRIHETEQALDELNHQKKQTEDEIAQIEEEIRRVNEAIEAKKKPMKLAQTRLENRTYRPGQDLCRDNVQYGLTDEVKQLETSIIALEEKLKQSQHSLDGLEQILHKVNKDIKCKTNSLRLDEKCTGARNQLKPSRPKSQHEMNRQLTGAIRERSKELA